MWVWEEELEKDEIFCIREEFWFGVFEGNYRVRRFNLEMGEEGEKGGLG